MTGPAASGLGAPPVEVTLGRIASPFGVKGWVKVKSYTEPLEGILGYREWHIEVPGAGRQVLHPVEGRRQGEMVVAHLAGVDNREAAAALLHCEVRVPRAALPDPGLGQYYWADLVGLEVVTLEGIGLGRVDHFVETPANPIMVVLGERERWLPLVPQHLKRVDLGAGQVVVDWDPDF